MNNSQSSPNLSIFHQPEPATVCPECLSQPVRIARWTTLVATTGLALLTIIAGLRAWLYLRASVGINELELQELLQVTILAAGATFVGALFVVYLEWRYPRSHR